MRAAVPFVFFFALAAGLKSQLRLSQTADKRTSLADLRAVEVSAGGSVSAVPALAKVAAAEQPVSGQAQSVARESSSVVSKPLGSTFLCVNGSVLPKLQVIGAQKSATSTMFEDLAEVISLRRDQGCLTLPERKWKWPCKEVHHFDISEKRAHPELYTSLWGSCDGWTDSHVVADFTPDYLWKPGVPGAIKDMYGAASKDITFVVSLREPLLRMQSAFHQGIEARWLFKTGRKPSFQEHVSDCLERFVKAGGQNWYVEGGNYRTVAQSMYGNNFEIYLRFFPASQFVVFPGNVYTQRRSNFQTNPVLQAMRTRLGLGEHALLPKPLADTSQRANKNSHAKLEQELRPADIQAMRKIFERDTRKLESILARSVGEGMSLVGYTGQPNDAGAVRAWLQDSWVF